MKWLMRHPVAAVVDLKPIDLQISFIVFNPRINTDSEIVSFSNEHTYIQCSTNSFHEHFKSQQ